MSNGQERQGGINVHFPNEIKGGVYANNMIVAHTKEEFILDFMMIAPPEGAVTARIVVSPGHAKRIYRALLDNLSKYEENFGPIQEAEEPQGISGFKN